jgi:hypothetical protein
MFVSFALAAGLLIANASNIHAAPVVVTSIALDAAHSLVQKAGWKYCYWKLKKNGKWKLKCD